MFKTLLHPLYLIIMIIWKSKYYKLAKFKFYYRFKVLGRYHTLIVEEICEEYNEKNYSCASYILHFSANRHIYSKDWLKKKLSSYKIYFDLMVILLRLCAYFNKSRDFLLCQQQQQQKKWYKFYCRFKIISGVFV